MNQNLGDPCLFWGTTEDDRPSPSVLNGGRRAFVQVEGDIFSDWFKVGHTRSTTTVRVFAPRSSSTSISLGA